jgi:hypothetical protein
VTEMAFTLLIIALTPFLAGAASGIFTVLIVSIHRGQKAQFRSDNPGRHAGAIARRALIGIRDDNNSGEEEQ